MDFNKFSQIKNLIVDEEFFLSYSGYVSEDILEAVGMTLRQRLEDIESSPQQIRQVFSIFVELMQNVIRYGDEGPQLSMKNGEKPSYGMLAVTKSDNRIVVISGNFIPNDQAVMIRQRLDELRDCDANELRQIYREKLRQPTEETSKGASLGLIEIARRSKTPPEYEITEGPGDTSFFVLKASA